MKGNKNDIIKMGELLAVDTMLMGNRIRDAREQKGLTQMKLAELVGMSTIAISNIEIGKSSPNLKNITVIASVLDISIDSIVCDENNKYEEYIHKILKKLNKMDEKGLKHIDKYIDLYNETMEDG